jgi:hypothetical protein
MEFIDVCGKTSVDASTGERSTRLLAPGVILYQVNVLWQTPRVDELEVIHSDGREVMLRNTSTQAASLVNWKKIVFNDTAACYFAHKSDAFLMALEHYKTVTAKVGIACQELE